MCARNVFRRLADFRTCKSPANTPSNILSVVRIAPHKVFELHLAIVIVLQTNTSKNVSAKKDSKKILLSRTLTKSVLSMMMPLKENIAHIERPFFDRQR